MNWRRRGANRLSHPHSLLPESLWSHGLRFWHPDHRAAPFPAFYGSCSLVFPQLLLWAAFLTVDESDAGGLGALTAGPPGSRWTGHAPPGPACHAGLGEWPGGRGARACRARPRAVMSSPKLKAPIKWRLSPSSAVSSLAGLIPRSVGLKQRT